MVFLISYTINAVNLNKTFIGSVSENSPPGTSVADVAVSNYTGYKFANPRSYRFFRINTTSGMVTTAVALDRENNDQAYTDFTIQAYLDSDNQCSPVVVGRLITNVTDVNDNDPEFTSPYYTGSIKEDAVPGTLVDGLVDVPVTDEDIGVNGVVNFALAGTGSNYFVVEKSNYNQFTIKTSGTPIDREVTPYVVLTLTGTDNPSNPRTGTTSLNITVIDINDNAPQFNLGTTVFSVEENAGPTLVTTLTATDIDEGRHGQVSYYLIEGGFGLFEVDASTGAVSTVKEIDRENRNVFNLSIEARNQGSPSLASVLTITVNIGDVNDERPSFSKTFYKSTYVENAACTTNILTVTATDLDEGSNANVRFSTTSSNFTVDPSSGAIRCANPLDYEEMQQHLIEITAMNPGAPSMSDTVQVEINVEDVNDNSPRFDKATYQSEITTWEWVTNNPVDVFEVMDDDSGMNGQFTFSMTGQADKFFIDGETVGVLRVKESASQPGASTTYKFNVIATDKGSPPRSVSVPVSVDVKKIQGNSTVQFSSKDFRFSIVENQEYTTTPFGTAKASHDVSVSVVYSLIHGGDFRIAPTSGGLTCSRPQDREKAPEHIMIVRAIDHATNASDLAVIRVTVEDENDNSPRFLTIPEQHVFSVRENSVNVFVARIIAEDKDAGENGTITYSTESQTPRTHFTVNPETGRITVSGELDREAFDEYSLVIKASDNADVPRTATTRAKILIADMNDNPPTFRTRYAVTVKEDKAWSTSVGIVRATDRDTPRYGIVTYIGVTATENGTVCPFSVSAETGVVKVSGDLDYETTSTYECIVTAVDTSECNDCTGRLTGPTTLSVTILDFNDNPPVFQGAPYRANISRDADINSLVTDNITATDRDGVIDGNGVVKYHILSSTDYFKIDRDSGNISVATPLDAVDEDEVTLRIKAMDLPQTDRAMEAITEVTISIITDKPRPFFKKEYTFNLKENERPDGDKRVAVTAYVRTESGEFVCNCSYEIQVSDHSGSLYVDSMTGELRQKDEIDREETGSRFYVTVKATDDVTGLYRIKQVEIIVADVNDNFPYFKNSQQNFTVSQSAPVGYVIERLTSKDADELSHPIYTAFTDDEGIDVLDDGTLVVRASLVNHTDVHMVVNVKEDRFEGTIDVSANTNTIVYINILPDFNQHAPVFAKDTYEASLTFLSRKGTEVKINDFRATDADGDTVTYAIQRGNHRDTFTIDRQTGKIYVKYTLDDTVPRVLELVVTATDSSSYPRTGSCTVQISLQDFTATECIAEDSYLELQLSARQRLIFLGLFIAMAILLAVTSLLAIFAIYKWRTSHARPEKVKIDTVPEVEPVPPNYDLLSANRQEQGRSFYRRLGRNSAPGVPDRGYLSPIPGPTPHASPEERNSPSEDAHGYIELQE